MVRGDIKEEERNQRDLRRFPLLCPGIYIYTSCHEGVDARRAAAATHIGPGVSKERARRKKREKSENLVGDYDRSGGDHAA